MTTTDEVDIEVASLQDNDDDPAERLTVEVAERLPVRREVVTDETLGTLFPLRQELEGLAAIARTLAVAAVVPKALQHRPADVLAVILTGRELGVGAMTAVRNFHVIEGAVTIPPKWKAAEVRRRGLGRVYPHQPPRPYVADDGAEREKLCPCGMTDSANDAEQAMWHAERNDTPGIVFTYRYTMEDASRVVINKDGATLDSKSNWKAYPQRMLSWRALGYLLDDAFAEVGTGLYSPDEMGAVTDEEGEPILDVASKEPLVPADDRVKPSPPSPPIQPDALADFQRRIGKLRDACPVAVDDLQIAYRSRDLPKLADLRHNQQRIVEALIVAAERKVADGAYGAVEEPTETPPPPVPDQPETAVEQPETAAETVEVPPPPFDPSGLPEGRSPDDDVAWAERAPDRWVDETVEETKLITLEDAKLRSKAFGLSTAGGEAAVRARLATRLVRRRMEQALP